MQFLTRCTLCLWHIKSAEMAVKYHGWFVLQSLGWIHLLQGEPIRKVELKSKKRIDYRIWRKLQKLALYPGFPPMTVLVADIISATLRSTSVYTWFSLNFVTWSISFPKCFGQLLDWDIIHVVVLMFCIIVVIFIHIFLSSHNLFLMSYNSLFQPHPTSCHCFAYNGNSSCT